MATDRSDGGSVRTQRWNQLEGRTASSTDRASCVSNSDLYIYASAEEVIARNLGLCKSTTGVCSSVSEQVSRLAVNYLRKYMFPALPPDMQAKFPQVQDPLIS